MADAARVAQVKERTREVLQKLIWNGGLTLDDITRQLLDYKLELPDEVIAAIPEGRRFANADELLAVIPSSAWEEHERREREARGRAARAA